MEKARVLTTDPKVGSDSSGAHYPTESENWVSRSFVFMKSEILDKVSAS